MSDLEWALWFLSRFAVVCIAYALIEPAVEWVWRK
jgi:hypothetical protein